MCLRGGDDLTRATPVPDEPIHPLTQGAEDAQVHLDIRALTEDLDARGYSVLRRVVSRRPLVDLASAIDERFKQFPKFRGGGMVTGHINCFPGSAARCAWDELSRSGVVD